MKDITRVASNFNLPLQDLYTLVYAHAAVPLGHGPLETAQRAVLFAEEVMKLRKEPT